LPGNIAKRGPTGTGHAEGSAATDAEGAGAEGFLMLARTIILPSDALSSRQPKQAKQPNATKQDADRRVAAMRIM
jgi:hypothetical protein